MDVIAEAKFHLAEVIRQSNADPNNYVLRQSVEYWTSLVHALEHPESVQPNPDTPFNPEGGGPDIIPFDPKAKPVNPMAVVGGTLVITLVLGLLLRK